MTRTLHIWLAGAAAVGLAATVAVSSPALSAPAAMQAKLPAGSVLPTEFALPAGFQPEGVAIGLPPYAFFGSRVDGDIYRVSLLTGDATVVSDGPSTPSLGMKVDPHGRLIVAGGTGGDGRVIDTGSGEVLASYQFATGTTFINDVVVTADAAWFTDSRNPFLYRVPLDPSGTLAGQAEVVQVPLSGDYVHDAGFNANGIARTPDGAALLIIQSATGLLLRVEPDTGIASTVDLGGELLPNGDGLLLAGRTLYVVQNQLNRVAVVDLYAGGTSGKIREYLTDPRFDIPTTVAAFGDRLYLPNARFNTSPTPTTPYTAVAIANRCTDGTRSRR